MRKLVISVGILSTIAATSYVAASYAVTAIKTVRTVASAEEAEPATAGTLLTESAKTSSQFGSALPAQATDTLRAAMAGTAPTGAQSAQAVAVSDAGLSGQAATVGASSQMAAAASIPDVAMSGGAGMSDKPTAVRSVTVSPTASVAVPSMPDAKPSADSGRMMVASIVPEVDSESASREPLSAASAKMRRNAGGAARRRDAGSRRLTQSRTSRRVASRTSAVPAQAEEAPGAVPPPAAPPKSLFQGFWRDVIGAQ